MGVGGEGVDVGAIVRLLLLQVAIESSGLQSRTVSHLISEVEYDKCKHVTAVNSTKHGIESLAGVKEQVPSYSWRLVMHLASRNVQSQARSPKWLSVSALWSAGSTEAGVGETRAPCGGYRGGKVLMNH